MDAVAAHGRFLVFDRGGCARKGGPMMRHGQTVRRLAATWLAIATLGVAGVALADHHGGGGGGGGGGGHSSGFSGHFGGGHSGGYASHSPSFAGSRGHYAPSTAFRSHYATPASHPGPGGYATSRAIAPTRAFTPDHGHGPWGRPGWYGYPHYGRPYYTYVGFLPGYYSTFWWGGIPYYYADSTYYVYDGNVGQYEVVPPPAAAQGGNETAPATGGDAYVYPNNGQSPEQQSQDRYECHRWATDQTGFDPTQPGGGVASDVQASASDAYRRAEAACLQGRGYTVR